MVLTLCFSTSTLHECVQENFIKNPRRNNRIISKICQLSSRTQIVLTYTQTVYATVSSNFFPFNILLTWNNSKCSGPSLQCHQHWKSKVAQTLKKNITQWQQKWLTKIHSQLHKILRPSLWTPKLPVTAHETPSISTLNESLATAARMSLALLMQQTRWLLHYTVYCFSATDATAWFFAIVSTLRKSTYKVWKSFATVTFVS